MNTLLKLFLFFLLSLASSIALAEPPITAGAEVDVKNYQKHCDCYEIAIVGEDATGPNFAHPEALAVAVAYKGGPLALKKNPKDLENKTLTLKQDLQLLSDKEMIMYKLLD